MDSAAASDLTSWSFLRCVYLFCAARHGASSDAQSSGDYSIAAMKAPHAHKNGASGALAGVQILSAFD
jgi:hypothetical protein